MSADIFSGDGVDTPYMMSLLDLGKSVADSLLALNLPGVKQAEIPPLPSVKRIFSDAADLSLAEGLDSLSLDNSALEAVESGLEKDSVEGVDKEMVDDVEENEQEFSRQLQACTAQMESTMMEDKVPRPQTNSTVLEEPSVAETKEDDEEEDDFEDAVEADDAEEDFVELSDDPPTYRFVEDRVV